MDSIVLFGGTFNPIHVGHLIVAQRVAEYLEEDVWLMPTGNPPHKKYDIVDATHRYNMCSIAISDNSRLKVTDIEINSDGVNYTIDTVKRVKSLYKPEKIYFVVGLDFLDTVFTWKEYKKLLKRVIFVIVSRPSSSPYKEKEIYKKIEQLKRAYSAEIIYIDDVAIQISSSEIRQKIKDNKSVRYYISNEVIEYIDSNNLYVDYEYIIKDAKEYVKNNLSKKRYEHIISVAETANKFGDIYNIDRQKTTLAGIMHDYAKEFTDEEIIKFYEERGLEFPKDCINRPNLAHGEVASIIMQEKYGVKDADIINAVKNHTFGRCGMSALELIIGIADVIEPKRNYKGDKLLEMKDIEETAKTNLELAYYKKMLSTKNFLESRDKEISGELENIIKYYEDMVNKNE